MANLVSPLNESKPSIILGRNRNLQDPGQSLGLETCNSWWLVSVRSLESVIFRPCKATHAVYVKALQAIEIY